MAASGFHSAQHTTGGVAKVTEYPLTSGQTLYPGDVVKITSGAILKCTATTDQIYGVVATYSSYGVQEFRTGLVDGPAWNMVRIYDDLLNTVFVVDAQHATTSVATVVGTLVPIGIAAGNATLGTSGDFCDLDGSMTSVKVGVKVIERHYTADTTINPDWGSTHLLVRCQFVDVDATSAV